ncbi:MAG: DUF3298 domain-containing protein [Bacteroidota bacterium]
MRLVFPLLFLFIFSCNQKSDQEGHETENTSEQAVDTFTYRSFAVNDSISLLEDMPDGPMFRYDYGGLVFTNGTDAFQKMVADTTNSADSMLTAAGGDYEQAERMRMRQLFEEYRNEEVEQELLENASVAYERAIDEQYTVVHNKGGVLTVQGSYYAYMGGAHGIYGTIYRSFTDQPARILGLEEVMVSGFDRAQLGEMIKSRIDQMEDRLYDPEQPLDPTMNMGLFAEGIKFNYQPYEIGPYAAGEIEVSIPYTELLEAGLLRPEIIQMMEEK